MTKASKNAQQLVEAAVAVMQLNGMSEAEIITDLPRLAKEAVNFLAAKKAMEQENKMILLPDEIEMPYRAKVRAGALSTSTSGFTYRYFIHFEDAARCHGRVGVPEYSPGNAKCKRPKWLVDAQREHLAVKAAVQS